MAEIFAGQPSDPDDIPDQTFDTANVYSNGLSEICLGKAIKQHKLPRDEIVVISV
jgi:predicted oxidoreductase